MFDSHRSTFVRSLEHVPLAASGPSPITEDGSPDARTHFAGRASDEDHHVDVTAAVDAAQEQEDDAALMGLFSQPAADEWADPGRGGAGTPGGAGEGRGGPDRLSPGAGGDGFHRDHGARPGAGHHDISHRRGRSSHDADDVDEDDPANHQEGRHRHIEELEQDEDDDDQYPPGHGHPAPVLAGVPTSETRSPSADGRPAQWPARGSAARFEDSGGYAGGYAPASAGQSPVVAGGAAGTDRSRPTSPAASAALRAAQRETADAEARAEEAASEVEATLAELARVRAELASARKQAAAAEGRARAAEEAALAGTRRRAAGRDADDAAAGSAGKSGSAASSGKSDASQAGSVAASGGHSTVCVVIVGVVVFWAGALLQAFLSGDIAL